MAPFSLCSLRLARHLDLLNNSQEDYYLKINDVMSGERILDIF